VTLGENGRATCEDGLEPAELALDTPVSVNLWGFTSEIWPVLETAVRSVHNGVSSDGSVEDPGALDSDVEVLLPEVIGDMVHAEPGAAGTTQAVRVLRATGRCLGVTHAEDLPIVRSELAAMVGRGERPEKLWGVQTGDAAPPR
jgi:hypothetical protein